MKKNPQVEQISIVLGESAIKSVFRLSTKEPATDLCLGIGIIACFSNASNLLFKAAMSATDILNVVFDGTLSPEGEVELALLPLLKEGTCNFSLIDVKFV